MVRVRSGGPIFFKIKVLCLEVSCVARGPGDHVMKINQSEYQMDLLKTKCNKEIKHVIAARHAMHLISKMAPLLPLY